VLPAAALSAGTSDHGYVTNPLALPTTNQEADTYGRDLDGDRERDNALGRFFASLSELNVDLQGSLTESIERGDVLMLHELRTPSLRNTRDATWQVLYAEPTADPDFDGTGSFDLASSPRSPRLSATIKNRRVKTAAGRIPLKLDLGLGPFTLDLIKARVFATCLRSKCSDGRINGALTAAELDEELIPELAELFTALVQRDCPNPGAPDGGCMADSEGKTIRNVFDADKNHVITATELRESSLVPGVVPDLDLRPNEPGEDAMSVGVGFEAAAAQLVR
jgi:hypothetical protein